MKKILCLISVLILIFAVVSCDKKKKDELPDYEEQVSKEIKADEGGKVESSDGKTSVDIPAGALDEDTTITMTIRSAEGYEGTEDMNVVGSIVEFEPSGKVFKKPIIITMPSTKNFDNKVVSAAVLHKTGEAWSYDGHGAIAVLHDGKDAAGDPIMTTAAGDPIMLNAAGDPIMQSTGEMLAAAGDPIMLAMDGGMSAAGDPIMQTAAGKQIGISAAGDPIMNSAAGDPIMMTTGHFSAYTFVIVGEGESAGKPDDDEPVDDSDTEEPEPDDDTDTEPDDDTDTDTAEPEILLPTVLCTGLTVCSDGYSLVDCPKEGEELYGQDANYIARGSCVPKRFTKKEFLYNNDGTEYYAKIVEDENTHLMWCVDKEVLPEDDMDYPSAKEFCESLNYGGYEDWRLPNPREFMTITDEDSLGVSVKKFYFTDILAEGYDYWTSKVFEEDGAENAFVYAVTDGIFYSFETASPHSSVFCVRGEEYGTSGTFTSRSENGKEAIWDSDTNLLWQKEDLPGEKTWKEALKYCETLVYAGFDDWRLPNKHELASLVDFSKAGESVVSSFPGMTADTYWTSTVRPYYGGDTGGFVVEMATGKVTMDYSGDPDKTYSVRCVRSDLKAKLPEGEVYPCDATAHGPCKDANGKIWSSRILHDGRDSDAIAFNTFAEKCRYRGEADSNKWRIPTISELRTTIPEGNLAESGACGITDLKPTFENFDQEKCSADPTETTLYDYGYLISGTLDADNDDLPWVINTVESLLGAYDSDQAGWQSFVGRCVLDESLDYKKTPYFDTVNALHWSNISDKSKYWYEAAAYCQDLVEDGSNNWRVPTMEELQTLVNDSCEEEYGGCPQDLTGAYSVFGDIGRLWSSTFYDGTYFGYTYDFSTAQSIECVMSDGTEMAKVRCVRGEDEDANVSGPDFPYIGAGGFWSEVSGKFYTYDSASAYCDSLNAAEYGGFVNWRLPEAEEVAWLIDEDICGSNADQFSNGVFETSRCFEYSFEGYSVIGDMFKVITSTQDSAGVYYMFDFASGKWTTDSYPSGYVRCFTSGS